MKLEQALALALFLLMAFQAAAQDLEHCTPASHESLFGITPIGSDPDEGPSRIRVRRHHFEFFRDGDPNCDFGATSDRQNDGCWDPQALRSIDAFGLLTRPPVPEKAGQSADGTIQGFVDWAKGQGYNALRVWFYVDWPTWQKPKMGKRNKCDGETIIVDKKEVPNELGFGFVKLPENPLTAWRADGQPRPSYYSRLRWLLNNSDGMVIHLVLLNSFRWYECNFPGTSHAKVLEDVDYFVNQFGKNNPIRKISEKKLIIEIFNEITNWGTTFSPTETAGMEISNTIREHFPNHALGFSSGPAGWCESPDLFLAIPGADFWGIHYPSNSRCGPEWWMDRLLMVEQSLCDARDRNVVLSVDEAPGSFSDDFPTERPGLRDNDWRHQYAHLLSVHSMGVNFTFHCENGIVGLPDDTMPGRLVARAAERYSTECVTGEAAVDAFAYVDNVYFLSSEGWSTGQLSLTDPTDYFIVFQQQGSPVPTPPEAPANPLCYLVHDTLTEAPDDFSLVIPDPMGAFEPPVEPTHYWYDLTTSRGVVLISGHVRDVDSQGISGVTLPIAGITATTDPSGFYSTEVDEGWSGSVAPSKDGYVFDPTQRVYKGVTSDLTDEDYTGIQDGPGAPTCSVSANPPTITAGGSTLITWSSDAASCSYRIGGGAWVPVTCNGSQYEVAPDPGVFTVELSATGPGGTSTCSATVTVNPPPPPTCLVSANPPTITAGGSTLITWSSDAASCSYRIDGGAWVPVACNGSQYEVAPDPGVFTVELSATGPGGTSTCSATVTVNPPPPPTCSVSANPPTITAGGSTLITWSSDAASCSYRIGGGAWVPVACNGSQYEVAPDPGVFTVELSATGPGGTSTCSTTVTVNPPPPPTCNVAADPETIAVGESTTFTWSSNGDWCEFRIDDYNDPRDDDTPWTPVGCNGVQDEIGPFPAVFRVALAAHGAGGTSSCSVLVTVQ